MEKTMDKIVNLANNRGFIFPGSQIYGGLANTWDYGPLGVELKNNVKKAWWQKFVQESETNVGVDCAILMNPQTWVASGHLKSFSDPLLDCKSCGSRFRADQLIEKWAANTGFTLEKAVDGMSQEEMMEFINAHEIPCPECGKHNFTDIRQFNLMFKTFQGRHGRFDRDHLSASRNGTGYFRQLQERRPHDPEEDPVRHLPDRQILPQ